VCDRKRLMARAVPEWIGKTPDSAIPPRVKLRVWERQGGRCALTGVKINPGDRWEVDHIVALINGGENREDNLQIVLAFAHKAKTKADVDEKAKVARLKQKHLGMRSPKRGLSHPTLRKKLNGQVEVRNK
jgi:5-methylcytosine-specific restriction enzyme A